jgi:hypothetical protein
MDPESPADTERAVVRAAAALYNAGHREAAHDPLERRWLATRDSGLQGLLQFAVAVSHAEADNAEGARGLAGSAGEYLAGTDLPVNAAELRSYAAAVADDPAVVERRAPPTVTYGGEAPALADLGAAAAVAAAPALGRALDGGGNAGAVETGAEYAREALAAGEDSRFLALVWDFVRDDTNRPVVRQRLADQVTERRRKEEDVEGLF